MYSALYDLDDLKNIIGNEEMMKASLDSLHDLAYNEKKRTRSEGQMPFFSRAFRFQRAILESQESLGGGKHMKKTRLIKEALHAFPMCYVIFFLCLLF